MRGEALEIWILTLTSLNLVSAGFVIGLIFFDNRRNGWKIPPEYRTPIHLAISIFAANILFCVRQVNAFVLEPNEEATETLTFHCSIYNEISWLGIRQVRVFLLTKIIGIWCPILILTLRLCFIASGDISKVLSPKLSDHVVQSPVKCEPKGIYSSFRDHFNRSLGSFSYIESLSLQSLHHAIFSNDQLASRSRRRHYSDIVIRLNWSLSDNNFTQNSQKQ
jgi:hypothetical protein